MEWVVGTFAIISIVIAVSALMKISNMQAQISRKLEGTFRQALGALRTNADETDKLLKKMSDRILALEDKVNRTQHSKANTKAELSKLRNENVKLREKSVAAGKPKKKKFF